MEGPRAPRRAPVRYAYSKSRPDIADSARTGINQELDLERAAIYPTARCGALRLAA
jgi:hypothetical protein